MKTITEVIYHSSEVPYLGPVHVSPEQSIPTPSRLLILGYVT